MIRFSWGDILISPTSEMRHEIKRDMGVERYFVILRYWGENDIWQKIF